MPNSATTFEGRQDNGPVGPAGTTGQNATTTLTAGSHTILVAAAGTNSGATAIVSGNSTSVLQGQLTVLILNK